MQERKKEKINFVDRFSRYISKMFILNQIQLNNALKMFKHDFAIALLATLITVGCASPVSINRNDDYYAKMDTSAQDAVSGRNLPPLRFPNTNRITVIPRQYVGPSGTVSQASLAAAIDYLHWHQQSQYPSQQNSQNFGNRGQFEENTPNTGFNQNVHGLQLLGHTQPIYQGFGAPQSNQVYLVQGGQIIGQAFIHGINTQGVQNSGQSQMPQVDTTTTTLGNRGQFEETEQQTGGTQNVNQGSNFGQTSQQGTSFIGLQNYPQFPNYYGGSSSTSTVLDNRGQFETHTINNDGGKVTHSVQSGQLGQNNMQNLGNRGQFEEGGENNNVGGTAQHSSSSIHYYGTQNGGVSQAVHTSHVQSTQDGGTQQVHTFHLGANGVNVRDSNANIEGVVNGGEYTVAAAEADDNPAELTDLDKKHGHLFVGTMDDIETPTKDEIQTEIATKDDEKLPLPDKEIKNEMNV